MIGLKVLREDGASLREAGRVIYPVGEWVTVPGNGAYVSISSGLLAGGVGPIVAAFECHGPTGAHAPKGVGCFRCVRRLPDIPTCFYWPGDLAEADSGLLYLDWLAGQSLYGPLRTALDTYLGDPTIAREISRALEKGA